MKKIKDIGKKFYLLNRIGRIDHRLKPHIDAIRKSSKKNKRVEEKIDKLKTIHKRIRIYFIVRNVFMLLLYASAISAIASDIVLLSGLSDAVVKVSGIIGATIWLIGVTVFNRLIDLNTTDAYVLASEIISASPLK